MNDYDWVAAENEKQAKEHYEFETGFSDIEIEEDFEGEVSLDETMLISVDDLPNEVQKKALVMERIHGVLWVRKSFSWMIEQDKITKPCIIASTEC
nr:hypothetical protein [Geomicrobium sediminis]